MKVASSVPCLLAGSGRSVPGAPTPQGCQAVAHRPRPALQEWEPQVAPFHTAASEGHALSPKSESRSARGSTRPGWSGPCPLAPHLPQHLNAAPATASYQTAPAQPEGPAVVAKASYLRPILVLNPVLCLVPRSPPSQRSRQLKKPGAAEFRQPAPQPRGGGDAWRRETRGGWEPARRRAEHAQCAAGGGACLDAAPAGPCPALPRREGPQLLRANWRRVSHLNPKHPKTTRSGAEA